MIDDGNAQVDASSGSVFNILSKKFGKIESGIVYLTCFSLIGVLFCCLTVSYTSLVEDVGSSVVDASYVFFAKGIGAILASFISPHLYDNFNKNDVLSLSILIFIGLLILLAFNTSLAMLYLYYFLCGIVGILIDSGSVICLVRLFEKEAGPWIGGGVELAFFLSIAIAVGIRILVDDVVETEFLIYLVFPGACLILLQFVPMMTLKLSEETTVEIPVKTDVSETTKLLPMLTEQSTVIVIEKVEEGPHYYAEILCAIGIIFNVALNAVFAAYITIYADDTGVMDTRSAEYLILTVFVLSCLSKAVLLIDQMYFINLKNLPNRLIIFMCVIPAIAAIFPCIYPDSSSALWISFCLFGLLGTNVVPLLFDLLNRVTNATSTSISIAYVGLVLGDAFLQPAMLQLWEATSSETFLYYFVFGQAIEIPIVIGVLLVSYHPAVKAIPAMDYFTL